MVIAAVIVTMNHYAGFGTGGNTISGSGKLLGGNLRDTRKAVRPLLPAGVNDANAARHEKASTALYVVRNGVRDEQEFRAHPDKIARQFYRALGITKIGRFNYGFGGFVYVSYRKGNQCCFWTNRRRLVAPTEALYTDTGFWIRKRCGNALSDQPMSPVESNHLQPNDDQLGTEDIEARESDDSKPDFEVLNLLAADFTLPKIPDFEGITTVVRTGAAPGTVEKSMVSTGAGPDTIIPNGGLVFSAPYLRLVGNGSKDPIASTPEPGQFLCIAGALSLLAGIQRVASTRYNRGGRS